MGNDKRKAVRINKLFVVKYKTDEGIWDISHIKNISEIGIQVTTNGILKAGTILKFRMIIPFEPFKWLEFSGKVLDSTELESFFGKSETHVTRIEFVNLKEEQKDLIRRYVDWFVSRKDTATT
ncbi:MAG: PilZ domain-containing protein [Candidatus Omnitrophota bacterium]|nr:PilZ domain-containing protein [Candidatus Omnitrophota bacterium]